MQVTPTHAEEYSRDLAYEEYSSTPKAAIQKAIQTLFKFQRYKGTGRRVGADNHVLQQFWHAQRA